MDVCASYHDGQLMRYSVSLTGYGFFGDVLRESESMRLMGPMRYDLAGETWGLYRLGNNHFSFCFQLSLLN